ncbi:TPA: hypothetical protein HA318_03395 [Candidatus Micrarchaeota archaeon]|nr:MAG: hypothetical protein AUJ65_00940 [Candidatus Micrarchaeota archaeon CG1_02_51_15]HII39020.1 hypothetical protein [Candidatus Micrarchaeota archaeon]
MLAYVASRAYRRFAGDNEFKRVVKWVWFALLFLVAYKIIEIVSEGGLSFLGEWQAVCYNLVFVAALGAALVSVFKFEDFSQKFGFAEKHLL